MTFDAITLGSLIMAFDKTVSFKVYIGVRELNLREIVTSLDRTVSSITITTKDSVSVALNPIPMDREEET